MIENHLTTNTGFFLIMWRIFYNYIFFKRFYFLTWSFSIMWRIFYNYIFFKRFYFGDMIFLNYVADFLQLHLFQKVQFLWQDLSAAIYSSECSILVTWSFSIMWRIFYNYIFFKRFNFCDKIFLNHVADFCSYIFLRMFYFGDKQVIHHFGNWSSYPPL